MIGERHIREALALEDECPCLMCQDGILLHPNGLHELPEPGGMVRCQQVQKDPVLMNTKRVTESELISKAVGPRVTDEQVEAFIQTEHYFTAQDGVVGAASAVSRSLIEAVPHHALSLLTICVLVLQNGFTVNGISACADPANFDADIGRRLARADAKNKIWAHLGFELRSKMALIDKAISPTLPGMTTHVGTKVVHAAPMTRGDYNSFRGWPMPANENPDDAGYLLEYGDGGEANVPGFFGYVSWSPKDVFDRSYGEALL